jgi:hypothetical protein
MSDISSPLFRFRSFSSFFFFLGKFQEKVWHETPKYGTAAAKGGKAMWVGPSGSQ